MADNKYAGTQTEKNLQEAFAGESQARNKYTFFASVAKKEGYEQMSALFLKTADNEKEHAKMWFKELNGIGNTAENLVAAAEGENYEWTDMYEGFAKTAEENDAQLALAPYYYFTSSIYKGECTGSRVGLMTAKSLDTPLYLAKINGKEIYELAEKYLADSDEKLHITNKYELPIASGMKLIVRQEENGFSLKDIEVNKKEIDKEKEYSILL